MPRIDSSVAIVIRLMDVSLSRIMNHRWIFCLPSGWLYGVILITVLAVIVAAAADSDPDHMAAYSEKPLAWPGGVIPYDIDKLSDAQKAEAKQAMKRWMDTGASIKFIPRHNETEYV